MPGKYNVRRAYGGKNAKRIRGHLKEGLRRVARAGARSAMSAAKREIATAATRQGSQSASPALSALLMGAGDYKIKKYKVGKHGFGGGGKHSGGGSSSGHGHAQQDIGKGCMKIKHSEYIGDLIANSSAFNSQSYGINPGNSGMFPWLSSVAIQFQNYHFRKLVVEYRPLVSEGTTAATNTLLSMGAVIAGTQYNSPEGPYTSKATMAESDYAVTAKPSEHILHAIECDAKYNPLGVLFVSANQNPEIAPTGEDIRMQNLGIFQLACQGVPYTPGQPVDLGEIWVHYEVDLYKPQLNAGLSNLLSCHYSSTFQPYAPYAGGAIEAGATTDPVSSYAFGNGTNATHQPSSTANSLLDLTFGSNFFSFPLSVTTGQFLCVYTAITTNLSTQPAIWGIDAPFLSVSNGTLVQMFTGQVPDQNITAAAPVTLVAGHGEPTNCVTMVCAFVVSVNAPGAALCSIQLVPTLMYQSNWDLYVTPYNSDIVT